MNTRPPFTSPDGRSSDSRAPDGGDGVRSGQNTPVWTAPEVEPYPATHQTAAQPAARNGLGDAEPERPAAAAGSSASTTAAPQTRPERDSTESSSRAWWGTPWNPPGTSVPDDSATMVDAGGGANSGYPGGAFSAPGPPSGPTPPFGTPPPFGPTPPPSGPYYGPPQTAGQPAPPPRRKRLVAAAIAIALVSAGVGGGVGALVAGGNSTPTVVSSSGLLRSTSGAGTSPAASGTVSAAAQTILPSVVTIAATSRNQASTGSGVIIRQDGYILTNNHVVSDAAQGGSLQVTTQDGKEFNARIIGTDPTSDLAVVKIDATGLRATAFGNSDALAVGELVVAVGSPLGLSGTVTSGIVSAIHRPVRTGDTNVQDSNAVLDAIQTDAPINPGNSGGPLTNSKGELIGINSAIATVGSGSGGFGGQQEQQSGNIGVGFAIPSNYAQSIAEELISKGSAVHPYLGVNASTAGASQTDPNGDGTGAKVENLVGNGPAQQAGLQRGDVITKLGDRRITSVDGLIAAVRSQDIGSKVTVTYTRNGQTHTAEVTLAQQPPS
ncbi:S1C family serine protease [Frankia sp. CiP3]|uniref:S1C family serine protease n=1 Tax=Frankia sp. CiP3 TaxID=2880971 RepID=UPI001EF50D21|nr:trypsin-like peptidase domain-containing protein [Frankia sp. CiP3]